MGLLRCAQALSPSALDSLAGPKLFDQGGVDVRGWLRCLAACQTGANPTGYRPIRPLDYFQTRHSSVEPTALKRPLAAIETMLSLERQF